MNILMVLTSHNRPLGDTGRVAGFWLEEFADPYYVFKDAGAMITIASPRGGQPPIDPKSDDPEFQTVATRRFKGDGQAQQALAHSARLSEVAPGGYDAMFYAGGHGPLWDLAHDPDSIRLIESMYADGKPVAAVGHGPAAFLHAKAPDGSPLVQGKEVTSFADTEEAEAGLAEVVPFLVEDMLVQNGARYSKAADWHPCVRSDGNLITGQNPASSESAAHELLQRLSPNPTRT
ncbi:type 1 glutamine amidotransferase domain-containing protein [Massilia horti]|uniref:Type 1 glutamine amidotransferase domain-containing protein n=1 Tax=Massilia horti TaxID=2562153 RepID=A0A4Y9T301_9BURK|nr:type 1 glutamine amidotransferase domain-containing protein [Massilia horti]TFW34327.1 type 1 glutamine amidotransferase domain-containing protein [Massilia horti]